MNALLRQVLLAALLIAPLNGATFSFQGIFSSDDQLQLFDFALSTSSTVSVLSLGYGGGIASSSIIVPPGGFDTLFTLFQGDGTQIGMFDDDPSCAHANSHNGACLDSYFSGTLPQGSYILALTVSGNTPNGDLNDGFAQQGNGNFTCANGFCDVFGNQNNGSWAIDFASVDSAAIATPEPLPASVAGFGLMLLLIFHRSRHQNHEPELK